MLRRLYNRLLELAAGPKAERVLAGVSFAESSFFPIPPDALLVPMVMAKPENAYRIALICTVASVLGGLLGYAIGALLFSTVGTWLIGVYGLADKIDAFQAAFQKWGLWIILIKGLTPIPFKLVTIASGIAHFNIAVFIVGSIITRGARFFLVAGLVKRFGPAISPFIEKQLYWVTGGIAIILIGGIYLATRL